MVIGLAGLFSMGLCLVAIVLLFLGHQQLALPLIIVGVAIMLICWGIAFVLTRNGKQ